MVAILECLICVVSTSVECSLVVVGTSGRSQDASHTRIVYQPAAPVVVAAAVAVVS
jgi:hypothetical protein